MGKVLATVKLSLVSGNLISVYGNQGKVWGSITGELKQ